MKIRGVEGVESTNDVSREKTGGSTKRGPSWSLTKACAPLKSLSGLRSLRRERRWKVVNLLWLGSWWVSGSSVN
jgi:hypothetical protein